MTDDLHPSNLHPSNNIDLDFHHHHHFHHLPSLYPEPSPSYLYPIMLTQATYQQAGIPFILLGQPYQRWRSDDLRLLLNNFGVTAMEAAQKIDLVHGVHHLIENRLMPDDPDVVARLQQGRSLPTATGIDTLALGSRTLEDLLGGELTSARIKTFQRQRRRFTSEDFALPNLNTSSGFVSGQGDAEPKRAEDGDEVGDLLPDMTSCAVCLELLTPQVQNSSKITPTCDHRRDVCDECLRQAITIDLEQKVWDRIGCPSCGTLLAQEDVIRHGDPKAVAKYEERLTLASLSSDPNFHLCRHPGCTFGQEMAPDTNQQFMTCLQCRQLTCLSCRTVWHAGISCAQNIRNIKGPTAEQRKEEEASEALVAKTSKTCPHATCGARVDKISGCDHMKCSRCGSQYCWECQADQEKIWSEGNSAHEKGCRHWRPIGKGSPDVSDTSDDEGMDSPDDSDVGDAHPPERSERLRRGAIGGHPIWEQERQRPVPRRRIIEQPRRTLDPRARTTEPGRIMREENQEGTGICANHIAQLETIRRQAGFPGPGPITQGEGREAARQRDQALERDHQRRVARRAETFYPVPEATAQYRHTLLHAQTPMTEALQAARRRGQQAADEVQGSNEQYAQNAARHRAHVDIHELERMPTQQRSKQQLRDIDSPAEQRAQDIADHHTRVTHHQRYLQPPEGYKQQRQLQPTQQQALAPHPAHPEHPLAPRGPAMTFKGFQNILGRGTLAPPGPGPPPFTARTPQPPPRPTPTFAPYTPALTLHPPTWTSKRTAQPPALPIPTFAPYTPALTLHPPTWTSNRTPQPPPRETPIFPPGLPLFSPPGPLFSNPFSFHPSPTSPTSPPSPASPTVPPSPASPTVPPSPPSPSPSPSPPSPSSPPLRSTTPPLTLPLFPSRQPPAPPTGTPLPLAPLLRLQQTPDPLHQWVWTLPAEAFMLSELPAAAPAQPGMQVLGTPGRARTVMGEGWAMVRGLAETGAEVGVGMGRVVVEAWGRDGGEEEGGCKRRRIGGGMEE